MDDLLFNMDEAIIKIHTVPCKANDLSDSHSCKNIDYKERTIYQRWITEKRFDLYVNEDPDTGIIKGMMGTGMNEDEDKEGAFELHFIYVDPDFVRAGVGSEMLEFFEQKGREKDCKEFVIWVLEENGMGRNFYEKHGYHFDGKDKIFRRWNKREIRYVKADA